MVPCQSLSKSSFDLIIFKNLGSCLQGIENFNKINFSAVFQHLKAPTTFSKVHTLSSEKQISIVKYFQRKKYRCRCYWNIDMGVFDPDDNSVHESGPLYHCTIWAYCSNPQAHYDSLLISSYCIYKTQQDTSHFSLLKHKSVLHISMFPFPTMFVHSSTTSLQRGGYKQNVRGGDCDIKRKMYLNKNRFVDTGSQTHTYTKIFKY